VLVILHFFKQLVLEQLNPNLVSPEEVFDLFLNELKLKYVVLKSIFSFHSVHDAKQVVGQK
jgi:hypothetical protein